MRYLDLPDPPRPLSVDGPLRLLVMISSPSDCPPLDVEQEWSLLTGALAEQQAGGQVIIERLAANMTELRRRLRRGEFHVFHFVGHGRYRSDWGNGVLIMEDRNGRSHEVPGDELGSLLSEYDQTRLAVLNACEGARSDDASDPFAGMAQSLIQQGLPAVVAMQFEITDDAAITFAREFYGAIADRYPLEAALAEARGAIRDEGNLTEWGTPVLYSRAPDGRLFGVTGPAREEAERLAREEQAGEETERLAREEQAGEETERLAREEQAGEETERLAREEQAREETERLAREEQAREETERLAREEQAREETERLAREEQAREAQERIRKVREETARRHAREEAERQAQQEQTRWARGEKRQGRSVIGQPQWQLKLLNDEGATRTFRLSSPSHSRHYDITVKYSWKEDVIKVDGITVVKEDKLRDATYTLDGLSKSLGSTVRITVTRGTWATFRVKSLVIDIDDQTLTYDSGIK